MIRPGKQALFCATVLSTAILLSEPAMAFPTGVFIEVDPYKGSDINFLTNYPGLFGPANPAACATQTYCGGITGIFLKINWSDYDTVKSTVSGGTTTYTVSHDYRNKLSEFMTNLGGLETSCGCTLQLSFGLGAGSNANYNVLDVYAVSNGGTTTTNSLPVEIACSSVSGSGTLYSTFSTLVTGPGGNFPIQCVWDGPNPACINQPRIWGTDSGSMAANGFYVTAYTNAVLSIASIISGTPHAINLVKVSGVNAADLEIGIDGNPNLATQTGVGGSICGDSTATNAEEIWTNQSGTSGGSAYDVYDTGLMESTWGTISAILIDTLQASPYNVPSFAMDIYAENNLPPVFPAHCSDTSSNSSSWCVYNSTNSIPLLTTGEDEYLGKQALLSSYGINWNEFGFEEANLAYGKPSSGDSNYGTVAIPCAMQSEHHSNIGYQSVTTNTLTSLTLGNYLSGVSNATTYGAEYVELLPSDISAYIAASGTGSTLTTNLTALSQTFADVASAAATNAANRATTTECPTLSLSGGTFTTFY